MRGLLVAAAVCLVTALAAQGSVGGLGSGAAPAPGGAAPAAGGGRSVAASLTVSAGSGTRPVPASYLGLSTEYWSLPEWSSRLGLLERAIALLHAGAPGRLILRVGGDSADHSFWDPGGSPLPSWAFGLRSEWLARMRTLVRALGIRVILDLNLITDTPVQAAAWARAAAVALPPHSIVAFEIGNEPDIYSRRSWLAAVSGRSLTVDSDWDGDRLRRLPLRVTAGDYVRDFRADAARLAQIAPGVPLAGPALARPRTDAGWILPLEAAARSRLSMITVHRYPYSACARPGTPASATVDRILSPAATRGVANSLRPAVAAAHAADLPLRVTELNSVTCGGRPGVSDTFATALWAPAALFSLLRAGVSSVDIHVRANTINAPFALTGRGLVARPLLYGLVLFARSLGPGARLVRASLAGRALPNLGAWAVRTGARTLHVVLVDEGPRAVRLSMRLPARASATVQRLLAPSAAARGGVTLAGQWLDAAGRWRGRPELGRIVPARGRYRIVLPRRSAALVTLALTGRGRVSAARPAAAPAPTRGARVRAVARRRRAGRPRRRAR